MGWTMKRTMLLASVALAAATMAAGTAQAGANLIVNGDFGSPPVAPGWALFNSITGWTNSNTPADTIEVGASPIYGLPCISTGGGCQNLEVNANNFDAVSQTITGLTAGQTYDLSWEYGGRPGGGPQTLDVSFGGSPVTVDTGSLGAWSLNQFQVTALSSVEVLQFSSEVTSGLPSYGNEVTNVSLLAVPEPATWSVMLLGIFGMGALLRRTRKVVAFVRA